MAYSQESAQQGGRGAPSLGVNEAKPNEAMVTLTQRWTPSGCRQALARSIPGLPSHHPFYVPGVGEL